MILLGMTTKETMHGNPGEHRSLPAGMLVALELATNLPEASKIKYWARPVAVRPWPQATEDWALDVGVGLGAEDVEVLRLDIKSEETIDDERSGNQT